MDMVSNFPERLSEAMNGMGVTEFAIKLGVSKQAVSAWLNGTRQPKQLALTAMAQILSVNPAWLMGYDVPKERDDDSRPAPDEDVIDLSKLKNVRPMELKKFPLLGRIACGQPILTTEEHDGYIMADRSIDADFCLTAKGDSMRQSRICDGDTVFIKRMSAIGEIRTVASARIVAVVIDDEVTLKRVYYQKENDTLILADDNSKCPPILLIGSEIDNLNCIGKAVCFMSLL